IEGGVEALEVLTPEEFEKSRGATVRVQHRVVALEPSKGRLVVESLIHRSRHDEAFDRFILATGARARRLGVDGEAAPGVFSLRGLEDAAALKTWLDTEPVRHVVVEGGGFEGLEMAEAMRDRAIRATILDTRGRVLGLDIADPMIAPMHEAMRARGVHVRAEQVTAIETEATGRVRAVRTNQGELIGCQAVIVAIGIEPRTALAESAGVHLGETGAIAVDDAMRTNVRTVWACGDVIEVPRVVDGNAVHWPLAPIGRRTARVAARNAAGARPADRFTGVTPSVAVRAFGIEAAHAGLSLDEARASGFDAEAIMVQHWSRVKMVPGSKPLHVRYVVEQGSGRLLGGELVGAEGAALRANVLVPWIRAGTTVREIAEEMDLVYNPPIAPATDPLRIAAAKAMRSVKGAGR
ncbi:MAG: FAD-dependent oxidoreductase, partial [Myxococcales bacterium]|nr:FAD-dependent oxidoreductase [Myxococcales bacterium]